MQVRVRFELPDSPGALARLASLCGEAYVNILSVRVYPGLGTVTDDLILEIPDYWSNDDVRKLVLEAGGNGVKVVESSRGDLDDDAAKWLAAAFAVLEQPSSTDGVIAALLGPVRSPLAAEAERVELLRKFQRLATRNEVLAELIRGELGTAGPGDGRASLIGRSVSAATAILRMPRQLIRL